MDLKLKHHKPTSPGRRHRVIEDRKVLSAISLAPKSLFKPKSKVTGRNNQGKITVRHRGGGVKRKYRLLDLSRKKLGVKAEVVSIEYDPNRTANIAFLKYQDGDKAFVLAPKGLKVGQKVISGEKNVELEVGNAMPLKEIPSGVYVHNVELYPGRGGQLARSAGASVQVQGKSGKYTQVKLPSGEIRLINSKCFATIGFVGNEEHFHTKIGKAGISRKMGKRPVVRGVAMHAQAHPHGGGEGRTGTGGPARDKWGNKLGRRTRRNKRTQRFIIKRRKK